MSAWFYIGCVIVGVVALSVFVGALCTIASRFDRVEDWHSR